MDLGEPYYIFDIFADEQENIDKRKKKAAERGRTWKEWREDGAAYQVYEEERERERGVYFPSDGANTKHCS